MVTGTLLARATGGADTAAVAPEELTPAAALPPLLLLPPELTPALALALAPTPPLAPPNNAAMEASDPGAAGASPCTREPALTKSMLGVENIGRLYSAAER
jgi:hypothetical protein